MNLLADILTLIDRHEFEAAEALMRRAGIDTATAPQALYVQGLLAYGRQDYRLAKVKFTRAVKGAAGFTPPLLALGNATLALGEHDGALKAYRAALAIEPDNAAILSNIGSVLNVLGQYDEAETVLRRALELAPANPPAQMNLAQTLRARGDFDGALAALDGLDAHAAAAEMRADILARRAAAGGATA